MGKDPHFYCLLELQREQKDLSTSYAQRTEGPRNSKEEMLENRGDALVLIPIVDINVLINVGVLMITPCYQDSGYVLSEVTTISKSCPGVYFREGAMRTRKLDHFVAVR